jgi:hypothetical protein
VKRTGSADTTGVIALTSLRQYYLHQVRRV